MAKSRQIREVLLHYIPPSAWMISFSDLITLLLSFFVLFHALSPHGEKAPALQSNENTKREPYASKFRDLNLPAELPVSETDQGVTIFLEGSGFFNHGTELTLAATEKIVTLARLLKDHPVRIIVTAHTHEQELMTESRDYPSSWELSSRRALIVSRQMIDAGVERSAIAAMGYGSTKPRVENRKRGKLNRNERIEIAIVPREQPPINGPTHKETV